MFLKESIDENILLYEEAFRDCGDIVKRKFPVGEKKDLTVYISYIDMLVDRKLVEMQIINHLLIKLSNSFPKYDSLKEGILTALKDSGISTADVAEAEKLEDVTLAVLSGDTVLFVDGCSRALIVSTKGWPNRGVSTAETEVVVQGSKEAFTEVFRFNTVLIRRRIRDTKLKVRQMKVGRRSSTDIALMYMEDIVRPRILDEAIARIKNIDIDAIFDCGYVEQLIEDDWLSPFPQAQVTERPDKAASAIMEGRVVIVVDNSPFVLIIPTTFHTFYQTSEDYYQRFEIMSLSRLLRYIAGFITVALPGLYLAFTCFHPSMIPMLLIFKMAGARQTVPIPALIEILLMEFAFELLREAGIRLPSAVGGTIGIVGGLIIGQAAVEAGLVSPIVVIIVALTGIASFAVPSYALVSGFRIVKYIIIIMSGILGLFGFWIAALFVLIHLVSLKSFGIPYLYPFVSGDVNHYSELKDTLFRFPTFTMKNRPIFANPNQHTRLNFGKTGNKKERE